MQGRSQGFESPSLHACRGPIPDRWSALDVLATGGRGPPLVAAGGQVRNIRLVDGVGDHDIDCKVDGFGSMQLTSSVVRKV